MLKRTFIVLFIIFLVIFVPYIIGGIISITFPTLLEFKNTLTYWGLGFIELVVIYFIICVILKIYEYIKYGI